MTETRIVGSLSPKQVIDIKIAWLKKMGLCDTKCPHCGAFLRKFGILMKAGLVYCKKCLKYHTL